MNSVGTTASISDFIQFVQSARRKFLQLQHPAWEERMEFLRILLMTLRNKQERWVEQEALQTGIDAETLRTYEWPLVLAHLEKALGEADLAKSRPRGLMVLISPFGFSVLNSLLRLVPAVLAGNRVVLKLSSKDDVLRSVIDLVFEAQPQARELVLVVSSCDQDFKDILVSHPGVQALSFWGSADTWSRIRGKLQFHCRVESFFGGHSVAVVLDESQAEAAAEAIAQSFLNGFGVSPWNCTRVIAVDGLEERVAALLAARLGGRKGLIRKWSEPGYQQTLKALNEGRAEFLGNPAESAWGAVFLVRNFSLCSELRFQEMNGPFLFLDTIKYAHEINKKIQPMERLWSVQLWGEQEKVQRLSEKVDCALILQNRSFAPDLADGMPVLPWNRDSRLGTCTGDFSPWGDFFSVKVETFGPE